MPHRGGQNLGATLVPDLSQGVNAITQGIQLHKQQKAEGQRQAQLSGLIEDFHAPGISDKNQERILSRIAKIDLEKAKFLEGVIERDDAREVREAKELSDESHKLMLFFEALPKGQKGKAISDEVANIRIQAERSKDPNEKQFLTQKALKIAELGQLSGTALDIELMKRRLAAGDIKTVTKQMEARRKRQDLADQERVDKVAKESFEISQLPLEQQAPDIARRIFEGKQRGEDVSHLEDLVSGGQAGLSRAQRLQSNINAGRDVKDVVKTEKPQRTTVSPGQTVLEDGKPIFTAPSKPEKAQTPIGKARQDLKEGLITQKDFNSLQKTPKGSFQSSVGKLIGDKQRAIDIYGDGSEQVNAIQKAIDSDSKGEPPKFSDINSIRKEHTKESQDFIKTRDSVNKINAATENAAGDLSLIFNYMKVLDPGSSVRETEFANAQNAAGVPDRIRNQWNKLKSGEFLNPNQRAQFKSEALLQFESQLRSQEALDKAFRGIAERRGINPKDVIIDWKAGINPSAPENIQNMSTEELEAIANGR